MEKVKLGDIAVLINGDRGKNYPSQADITEEGDVPFVNAGHLTGRTIDFGDMNYISKEKYEKLNSGKFEKGDILYCLRGSLGKKAIVNDDVVGAIASSLVIIRPDYEKIDGEYLMFSLDSPSIKEQLVKANNGSSQPNLSAASVREYQIELPDISLQKEVVEKLTRVRNVMDERQKELNLLNELIKARFVEMFGDPIANTKGLEVRSLKDVMVLKAGDFTAASDISEEPNEVNMYPCYGGNGIRGYVAEYNQEGNYSLIGRQGALSGNVQYATGKFKNTEHALLVTPTIKMNSIWLNQLLINLDLKRYQTGAAQPGLSVKNLQEIQIIIVPIDEQNKYAEFVRQVDKSKVVELNAVA
ncbi:type I restriction-modification system S subunit [Kandleria vitulina DSM 20405]|uniref:Type I restriction-modification system S subunit n=1 Tax=Kandleria vitulina DSM 20405 TaxID=1410657 RepID=A0A0R2HDY0_9FIRM